jgi:Peptidase S24-like
VKPGAPAAPRCVVFASAWVAEAIDSVLSDGSAVRFRAAGRSMHPTIRDGETLMLAPMQVAELRRGDILLARQPGRLVAHRVVSLTTQNNDVATVLLRGDALPVCDLPVAPGDILARVAGVERHGRLVALDSGRARIEYFARAAVAALRRAIRKTIQHP